MAAPLNGPSTWPPGDVRYTKTIAKARDTHWYAFTAQESGLHIIKTESKNGENLDTQGYLLDENGVQVAMNDDVSFPNNPNFSWPASWKPERPIMCGSTPFPTRWAPTG